MNVNLPVRQKSSLPFKKEVTCKLCGAEYWGPLRHLMSRVANNMKMFSCYSTSTKLIAAKYRTNYRRISELQKKSIVTNELLSYQITVHPFFLRKENQMVVIDKLLVHWAMCLNFRRGNSRLAIKYFKIKQQLPSTTPLVRKTMKKLGPFSQNLILAPISLHNVKEQAPVFLKNFRNRKFFDLSVRTKKGGTKMNLVPLICASLALNERAWPSCHIKHSG